MNKNLIRSRAGLIVMGMCLLWTIGSTWLSAHNVISVFTELTSSSFALLVTIGAALYYVLNRDPSNGWLSFLARSVIGVGAVLFVVVMIFVTTIRPQLYANSAFFYWTTRAIPTNAWQQMVSDLDKVGRQSLGTNDISERLHWNALPVSLRQLGLRRDYRVADAQQVGTPLGMVYWYELNSVTNPGLGGCGKGLRSS